MEPKSKVNGGDGTIQVKPLAPESLSTDILTQALQEVREHVASVKSRIAELQQDLTRSEEEEQLLERLLAVRRGEAVSQRLELMPVDTERPTGVSHRGLKHPAVEDVVMILEEVRRPLHISELMRLLNDRGTRLPGSGTQANVIAHIRRDSRIVRPSRGMYGLAVWGLEEMPTRPQAPRHRRRRRVRSSKPVLKAERN